MAGAHDVRHRVDEDLAVADLARLGSFDDDPAHRVHLRPARSDTLFDQSRKQGHPFHAPGEYNLKAGHG